MGAWPIGVSGAITLGVAVLAFLKRADTTIVKADWFFLAFASTAIPLWFFTANPLFAVIILTIADLSGFGPSVRKAYQFPYEENALFFGIGAVRNAFVIAALEHYSWTTALFPAAIGLACLMFLALILMRRRIVPAPSR